MTVGRFKFVLWTTEVAGYDEQFTKLKAFYDKYGCTYMHAAEEVAPDTLKEHIDGYYEYPTQRKVACEIKKFNKTFGKGFGDIAVARGTSGENIDYSQKEGRRFEQWGTPGKGQGSRSDLDQNRDALLAGETTVDAITVADPMMFHQYGRTLSKLEDIALRSQFRTWMTQGIWYYGATGAGKSHMAFNGYDPKSVYLWKLNDNGWQDGYTGQDVVVMNDFRGEVKFNELLNLLDKWPYFVARRGREPAPFLARKVIITAAITPSAVFSRIGVNDDLAQLYRRIKLYRVENRFAHLVTNPENPDACDDF